MSEKYIRGKGELPEQTKREWFQQASFDGLWAHMQEAKRAVVNREDRSIAANYRRLGETLDLPSKIPSQTQYTVLDVIEGTDTTQAPDSAAMRRYENAREAFTLLNIRTIFSVLDAHASFEKGDEDDMFQTVFTAVYAKTPEIPHLTSPIGVTVNVEATKALVRYIADRDARAVGLVEEDKKLAKTSDAPLKKEVAPQERMIAYPPPPALTIEEFEEREEIADFMKRTFDRNDETVRREGRVIDKVTGRFDGTSWTLDRIAAVEGISPSYAGQVLKAGWHRVDNNRPEVEKFAVEEQDNTPLLKQGIEINISRENEDNAGNPFWPGQGAPRFHDDVVEERSRFRDGR